MAGTAAAHTVAAHTAAEDIPADLGAWAGGRSPCGLPVPVAPEPLANWPPAAVPLLFLQRLSGDFGAIQHANPSAWTRRRVGRKTSNEPRETYTRRAT